MVLKPLTETFRPATTSQIVGQDEAVRIASEYAKSYKTSKKKALLLHGPPGVGKTTLALALASENNWELVEVNASDVRNKASIEEHLGASMKQQSLFGSQKLILIDEVDGLSGTKDRGGAGALVELIENSVFPVILTANDGYSDKLKKLRKICEVIEMGPPQYRSVLEMLTSVCKQHGITVDEQVLSTLARRAGGDMRGALTDLQSLATHKNISKEDLELLGDRRQAESVMMALQRILKGSDPKMARDALDAVDESIDDLFLWVDDNTPREYTKGHDLVRAFDALSRADVFKGRIMRWQHWRYLVYVIDEMTAGVALAKEEKYPGYTQYKRSTRPLTYWRANMTKAKKKAIAQKIAEKSHMSIRQAIEHLPYFSAMFKADANHPIIAQCEIEPDEVKWLVAKV